MLVSGHFYAIRGDRALAAVVADHGASMAMPIAEFFHQAFDRFLSAVSYSEPAVALSKPADG
jgi:hypothetical protein